MNIRKSAQEDKQAIRHLHQNAFGEAEGETVSQLAIDLLEDKTAHSILSLVAEQDDEVIGNIIFSPVQIEGAEDVVASILAPLGIAPGQQGKGIGTALIQQGLKTLKDQGTEIVLVLGDPNYYKRSGFKAGHHLKPPYTLEYPEAWMALELVAGTLSNTQGLVQCVPVLHSPELW